MISTRPTDARPAVAAFLSFLLPGLGQAYNGQRWLAAALLAPVLFLIGLTAAAVLFAGPLLLSRLLDGRFLVGLIVLDVALLGWRLVAIAQAHGHRVPFHWRWLATYATGGLIVATVMMHLLPAAYAVRTMDTLTAVTAGGAGDGRLPPALAGSALPAPSRLPDVSRERVTILLVGVDFAPGREHQLTDSMLVASIDPASGRSAMISVPRDLYGVPLPDGTPYNDKLNSLMVVASEDPARYPLGGPGTLKATIGRLLGTEIHYFAAIDIAGMKTVIDLIGGVQIRVADPIADPLYEDLWGVYTSGFFIEPGTYHMDGVTAMAYARSRMGEGDSDFTRAERQQQVLTAIRAELTAGDLLASLPGLLDAVRNSFATDVPSSRLPGLARLVQEADLSLLERVVLAPPEYVTPEPASAAGYILHPHFDAIRELGERLLGD